MRKFSSFVICFILILTLFVGVDMQIELTQRAEGAVIYVGGTGGGNFSTIQEGIDAANDGDTVYVYSGTYDENLNINKRINLTGENRDSTFIDGHRSNVINVTENWVNITGFTISNGTKGIYLFGASNNNISMNYFYADSYAIQLISSNYNIITTNYIDTTNGISLEFSNNNVIIRNEIIKTWIPISLISSANNEIINNFLRTWRSFYIESSSNNTVGYNNITCLQANAITMVASSENTLIENNFTSMSDHGIHLEYSSDNNILKNNVSNNYRRAIDLQYSPNNTIEGNEIRSNRYYGIVLGQSSDNNIVINNDVVNNSCGIVTGSNNTIICNSIRDNGYGIMQYGSNVCLYWNNISSNKGTGISISQASDGIIYGNNISNNRYGGIRLDSSLNYNITGNNFVKDGISIFRTQLSHFNSHEIMDSNLINGYPLHYFKNERGLDIDGTPIGQLILANCTDVVVKNVQINNTDVGIELAYSTNASIIFSNISFNNYGPGIYIYSSKGNNITSNNIISNIGVHGYGLGDGLYLEYSNGNNITSNIIKYNNGKGIHLDYSENNNLVNNTISSNDEGIYFSYSSGNYITGNYVSLNNMRGMALFQVSNITINNNSVLSNDGGIYISGLSSPSNCHITGNNIVFNSKIGISAQSLSYSEINHNNIISNMWGILFDRSSYNNIISNDILDNEVGINLEYLLERSSYNNTILHNNVWNNSYGINASSSFNNQIYHNNIIDNNNQANDNTNNENQWDKGYPVGGNYWSDYNGTDEFKGPNQDMPGSDGIGDTPYVIDADSQDKYPLMNPYTCKPLENYTILKQGWNLISIPPAQQNQNPIKVLEMIDGWYDAVQWYDNSELNDPWKHYKDGKPNGNDLSEINESMGFWIHITQPGEIIFLYNGTQPTNNQTIPLYKGWNMVGYPSLSDKDRTTALNNLVFGTHVDSVWEFNAATQTWEELGPSDSFELGRGYWVYATQDCVWEVPV